MKKVMAGAVLVAALAVTGCASAGVAKSTPTPEPPGTVKQGTSANAFKENTITLNDGRTVVCLTWSEYDTWNETKASGLDCDWERTKE